MFGLFKKKPAAARRAAGVYQHANVLLLHAFRRAPAGFLVAVPPAIRVPSSSHAAEVGKAVRQMLDAFQPEGEDPVDGGDNSAFLKATGFKSWKALQEPAKSCWIEEEAGRIELTPLKNGGSRGPDKGFKPFGVPPSTIGASVGDVEIGRALLEALTRSE